MYVYISWMVQVYFCFVLHTTRFAIHNLSFQIWQMRIQVIYFHNEEKDFEVCELLVWNVASQQNIYLLSWRFHRACKSSLSLFATCTGSVCTCTPLIWRLVSRICARGKPNDSFPPNACSPTFTYWLHSYKKKWTILNKTFCHKLL